MTEANWINVTVLDDIYEVEQNVQSEDRGVARAWRHRLMSTSSRNREWTSGRPPSGPHSKAD